ncbi:MAG: hypothetical protein ABI623_10465 [bacterium]
MNQPDTLTEQLNRFQQRALVVGGIGILLLAIGAFVSKEEFFQSYLYGYLFWMILTLGCLGILLLHHLVSGSWGHIVQRHMEAGARIMPVMAILFIPILLGLHTLYPWTNHEHLTHVVEQKLGYLNIPFFLARQVIYFGLWITSAFYLSNKSRELDKSGDLLVVRKLRIFSGPAMALFILSVTLASVDWMMSLEPEWFSSMYGIGRITNAALTGIALCILLVRFFADKKPLSDVLTTRHIHHLGNLLMAFTIFWAYIVFSEFLIIWSGNLPDDNMWHLRRMGHGWVVMAAILIAGQFALPFAILLSKRVKRKIQTLARIAAWIFLIRFIDLYWLIFPAFDGDKVQFHWLALVSPIAIGGIWMWFFIGNLKTQPLLPLNDPRFHNGMAEQH